MGRFFNREAAVVAAVLLLTTIAIGLLSDLEPWIIAASTAAAVALLHWPLTIWFQEQAIEFYTKHGRSQRALELAVEIRDSAMTRRERDKATIDLALVHLERGDYDSALRNLRGIVTTNLKPVMKAVVDGNIGYALGHLGRELEEAEKRVRSAIEAVPDEPLFEYFLGIIRLKQQRPAEARDLVQRSLTREPDPELPYPGERDYVLGLALKALGEAEGARAHFEKAASARSRFAELARQEAANAA